MKMREHDSSHNMLDYRTVDITSTDDPAGFQYATFHGKDRVRLATLFAASDDMLEALHIARAQCLDLHDSRYDAGKLKIAAAIAKAETIAP